MLVVEGLGDVDGENVLNPEAARLPSGIGIRV